MLVCGPEVEGGRIKDLAGDLEEGNTTFFDVHEFPDLRLLLKKYLKRAFMFKFMLACPINFGPLKTRDRV